MKKIISVVIIFLILSVTIIQISAADKQTGSPYSDSEIENIQSNYLKYEGTLKGSLCNADGLGYWSLINHYKQKPKTSWALETASRLVGQDFDKKKYAEILLNLIIAQQGSLSEQIEEQGRFDDLKDIGDYAWDVVDIALCLVGSSSDEIFQNTSLISGTAKSGIDMIITSTKDAKYYQTILQSYAESKEFLESVSNYAEDEDLKEAASILLDMNDSLLEERLEYVCVSLEDMAEFSSQFFMENCYFSLLKLTDIYESDQTVKELVDYGNKFLDAYLQNLSLGKYVFKVGILCGDIAFGTSDVFNRYQEMKVMADIAQSLTKAIENVSFNLQDNVEDKIACIQKKCGYYKMLISVHSRGEYLIYQLVSKDGKALSDINAIIEILKNDSSKTVDVWYDSQIESLTHCYEAIAEIFVVNDDLITELCNDYWINLADQDAYVYEFTEGNEIYSYEYNFLYEISYDCKEYQGTYYINNKSLVINWKSGYSTELSFMEHSELELSDDLLYELKSYNYSDDIFYESNFVQNAEDVAEPQCLLKFTEFKKEISFSNLFLGKWVTNYQSRSEYYTLLIDSENAVFSGGAEQIRCEGKYTITSGTEMEIDATNCVFYSNLDAQYHEVDMQLAIHLVLINDHMLDYYVDVVSGINYLGMNSGTMHIE